jgi:DNA-binding transcriptional MerR regulator
MLIAVTQRECLIVFDFQRELSYLKPLEVQWGICMNLNQSGSFVSIGVLARSTGFSVPTIRYYEDIRLIPHPARNSSGHRVYSPAIKKSLDFIKRCRDMGFSLEIIRDLVELSNNPNGNCQKTREITQKHLKNIHQKIDDLQQLATRLTVCVDTCNQLCIGPTASNCTIIEELTNVEKANEMRPNFKTCCND